MQERIRKVVHLATQNNVETLILGAWGCGVFKNKEKDIASMFNQVLEKERMKWISNEQETRKTDIESLSKQEFSQIYKVVFKNEF